MQSGAAGREKGFLKCFLRVPQAVGLYCSFPAAQASVEDFQKHFTRSFSQPDAPRLYFSKTASFSQSVTRSTHPVHLVPEGVDDELEKWVVLLLLLGEHLLGLAHLLPQLGEGGVIGLLILLELPLSVGQTLEGKLTLAIAIPTTLQCQVRQ